MTQPIISTNSDKQNWNQVNAISREVQALQTTQVFKDDAGVRRVILDKDGLRTSIAGVDVFSATADQLTFNSNNNVFKIVQTGTATIPAVSFTTAATSYGSSQQSVTIAHGLGYAPVIIAYESNGTVYATLPSRFQPTPSGGSYWANFSRGAAVDETNVYLVCDGFGYNSPGFGGAFTYSATPIKYFLLQETAN